MNFDWDITLNKRPCFFLAFNGFYTFLLPSLLHKIMQQFLYFQEQHPKLDFPPIQFQKQPPILKRHVLTSEIQLLVSNFSIHSIKTKISFGVDKIQAITNT